MYKIIINYVIKLGDFFLGYSIFKAIKKWEVIKKKSALEISELQGENLKNTLKNAIEKVPFYKDINIALTENSFNDLKKFPILTKEILRNYGDRLISTSFSKKRLIASYSSGSSGVQSVTYMSKNEKSNNWGILFNIWNDQGYDFGNNIIQTGMSPKRGGLKNIKDFLFRTNYINAFSHSEVELKRGLLKNLNKKNNVLIGYASSLNILAEIVIKDNIQIKLKSIISFGDKLFSHYKKNIEKAFKVKVKESYGANEGLMIAFQKDLDYLYILSPHVYVEVVDDKNNPVPDGEMGHLLITRLDGFSMPIIRYKLGDLGILLPKENYPKKREFNYPLLQQIVGRETDIVVLKDDKKLIVHSFTGIFEYISEIKQFKVIQNSREGIVIEYIKSDGFSLKVLENITVELQKHIKDASFVIEYKEVTHIASTKSGKPQIIESNL